MSICRSCTWAEWDHDSLGRRMFHRPGRCTVPLPKCVQRYGNGAPKISGIDTDTDYCHYYEDILERNEGDA